MTTECIILTFLYGSSHATSLTDKTSLRKEILLIFKIKSRDLCAREKRRWEKRERPLWAKLALLFSNIFFLFPSLPFPFLFSLSPLSLSLSFSIWEFMGEKRKEGGEKAYITKYKQERSLIPFRHFSRD